MRKVAGPNSNRIHERHSSSACGGHVAWYVGGIPNINKGPPDMTIPMMIPPNKKMQSVTRRLWDLTRCNKAREKHNIHWLTNPGRETWMWWWLRWEWPGGVSGVKSDVVAESLDSGVSMGLTAGCKWRGLWPELLISMMLLLWETGWMVWVEGWCTDVKKASPPSVHRAAQSIFSAPATPVLTLSPHSSSPSTPTTLPEDTSLSSFPVASLDLR